MPLVIKHKFVSAIPDSGDVTIVQPSNWNDDHSLSGSLAISFIDGLQAALDDKVGSNSFSAAVANFITSNSTSAMITTRLAPYLTSASAALSTYLTSNSFSAAISAYATSNSTSIMIAAALVPYAASNSVSVMIAAQVAPYLTSNSFSVAISAYATSNSVSIMIAAVVAPYLTSNSASITFATKQAAFNVQDEGVTLTTSSGVVTQINFVGTGISASLAAGVLTITAVAGAGSGEGSVSVSSMITTALAPYMTSNSISTAVATDTLTVRGAAAVSATMSAAFVTAAGRPLGIVLLGYQTFGGVNSVAFSGSWSNICILEMHVHHRMEAGGTSQTASAAISTDGGTTAHLNLQLAATNSASAPSVVILRAYGGNGRPRKQLFTQQARGSVIANFLAGTQTANSGFVNWIRYSTSSSMTDGTAMLYGYRTS